MIIKCHLINAITHPAKELMFFFFEDMYPCCPSRVAPVLFVPVYMCKTPQPRLREIIWNYKSPGRGCEVTWFRPHVRAVWRNEPLRCLRRLLLRLAVSPRCPLYRSRYSGRATSWCATLLGKWTCLFNRTLWLTTVAYLSVMVSGTRGYISLLYSTCLDCSGMHLEIH